MDEERQATQLESVDASRVGPCINAKHTVVHNIRWQRIIRNATAADPRPND
jgi:hypothetical protein